MLELRNIVKIYGQNDNKVKALKGVSLNFRQNELVSILGPSGCGKTTLLNIIGGLDKYTSGDLIINGKSTKKYKDSDWDTYRNKSIGFVFQNYNLIPHLSVLGNVELALTLSGISSAKRKEKAIVALQAVGLNDQIKKRPNQLSGGQMQRVAIARAIVNNPDIILADEPTGALDSVTSLQILDILKKLSKERLVIMVTHNKELAKKYSSRIIELLDGEITKDNNAYDGKDKLNNSHKTDILQTSDNDLEKSITTKNKTKKEKSSMSFFTAFMLSLKNLFTKKTRTILTSFAGSIGIVGVALVLAVSNGFTGYINKMQSDTLSGYPISVSTVTANMEAVTSAMRDGGISNDNENYPDDDKLHIESTTANLAQLGNYTYISPEFLEYVENYAEEDEKKSAEDKTLNELKISYASSLNVVSKRFDTYSFVDTSLSSSAIGASTSGIFYEGLGNENFISSQYDVIYGEYPTSFDEVALIVSSTNSISKEKLDKLGIEYSSINGVIQDVDFSTIVSSETYTGKTFKVVYNDDFYVPNNYENITSFSKIIDTMPTLEEKQLGIKDMFDSTSGITLKITGVLRVNPDSPLSIYSEGIVYTPELTQAFRENSLNSLIVTTQKNTTDKFFNPYKLKISELGMDFTFNTPVELQQFAYTSFGASLNIDAVLEYNLQQYGASTIPNSINFYPTRFEAKDSIVKYLQTWNSNPENENNKIYYADATSFLSNTLGQLVNIISYVLIAFASISLVVSSIMIGIITYVSVVERTKEIGVLRSLGARKKDIRRVFNAETLIIGLSAGLIGVLLSLLLTIPINIVIKSLASISNIAILNGWHAMALILISMGLTLISGLIPAQLASKKDPVVALRTE